MYSAHIDEKSVVAECFIRTLRKKINKHMTFVPKKMNIDKLDDTVNECNNAYHRTIKIKSVGVKSSTYIDFNKKSNKRNPKFEISDHVRISKYENIFTKGYAPNWSGKVFVIKKLKTLCQGHMY